MKTALLGMGIAWVLLTASLGYASSDLYAWMFNIDGAVTEYTDPYGLSGMPLNSALNAFDLGTYTYTESQAGAHSFIGYLDYEIDEAINTYFNERGTASGSLAAGQSWQIDSIDNYDPGNIFDNVWNNALNNTNSISVEGDVSWAMGWDYFLSAGQRALIRLTVGAVLPDAGFFLTQIDNTTGERIYLSGALEISSVPEPHSATLLGLGCLMLLMAKGVSGRTRRKTATPAYTTNA